MNNSEDYSHMAIIRGPGYLIILFYTRPEAKYIFCP